MIHTEGMLKLDETPTAQEEIDNLFALRQIEMEHEINVLSKRQGWLGKITGSDDPAFNIILLIVIICLTICILVVLLMLYDSDAYFKALSIMVSPVTMIIGYILGQNKK